MPYLEQHCEESERLFRNPFREVHIWLDAYAGTKEYGFSHRKKRHHMEGIQTVKELFGETASLAARQHIISDLKGDGWKEEEHRFPKDEQDYKKMGLF